MAARVNGDGTGIAPAGAGGHRGDAALYERDILEDVIPMIDAKYRTIAERNRAIVGFSMGGGQAGRIGLSNLDTFSYVGIMSAGMGGAAREARRRRWPPTGQRQRSTCCGSPAAGGRGAAGASALPEVSKGRHQAHVSRIRRRAPLARLAPLPSRPVATAVQVGSVRRCGALLRARRDAAAISDAIEPGEGLPPRSELANPLEDRWSGSMCSW